MHPVTLEMYQQKIKLLKTSFSLKLRKLTIDETNEEKLIYWVEFLEELNDKLKSS